MYILRRVSNANINDIFNKLYYDAYWQYVFHNMFYILDNKEGGGVD